MSAAINEMKRGLTVLVAAALLAGCANTPPALLRPGVIPLDTTDPKYRPYFRQVREKIKANWIYPYEAGTHGVEGDLSIEFVIAKNGDLQRIELRRSSGILILDNAVLNAVKLAQPFPPVPDDLATETLAINGQFNYRPRDTGK
jgi:TonB family protein